MRIHISCCCGAGNVTGMEEGRERQNYQKQFSSYRNIFQRRRWIAIATDASLKVKILRCRGKANITVNYLPKHFMLWNIVAQLFIAHMLRVIITKFLLRKLFIKSLKTWVFSSPQTVCWNRLSEGEERESRCARLEKIASGLEHLMATEISH